MLFKNLTKSCLFIMLCLFFSVTVQATTYSVTSLADAGTGSFRQAITDANNSAGTDIIEFTLSGAITLSGALPQITDSVNINGHLNGNTIRRITGAQYRILDIAGSSNVKISRLTIFGGSLSIGDGAGILIQSNCVVEINACCIRNCYVNTTGKAGGIYVQNQATLTMTNCTISDNSMSSPGGGGMVCAAGSDVTVMNCTFSHNTAGAILNYSFNFKMTNTILANSSPGGTSDFTNIGGAVSVNDNNIVELCETGFACNTFFSNADPQLGNLTINESGPTETRAIDSFTVAFNAGTIVGAPANDQNGTPRGTSPDIGAYEFPLINAISVLSKNTDEEQCSIKDFGPFTLQLFDLSGREIMTKEYQDYYQTEEAKYDVDNLNIQKGIYVMRLTTEQKVCSVKMVSNH